MRFDFSESNCADFDSEQYLRILVAIAKSDPFNGSPEIDYVRSQAERLGLDFFQFWNSTEKDLFIERVKVSHTTAMLILKDCIWIATLDGNFTLNEKELVYRYAERLDVPRSEVDALEEWLDEYRRLSKKWNALITCNQ